MSVRKVYQYPDPILREIAQPVVQFDTEVEQLVEDLFDTLYAHDGVGIAATQIGVPLRVLTIDLSQEQNQGLCMINPEIIEKEGEILSKEGCLSVAFTYETVKRAKTVKARYFDLQGVEHSIEADGLLSRAIQHEIDHLNGIIYVDYLSKLKQTRIRKKIAKALEKTL